MLPTEHLEQEHRVILKVLACLEKIVERCRANGKLEVQHLRDAIGFFREYADRCHHGKEEDHLFPAMEQKGFSRQFGPTGVMLYEHELGRNYIKGMSDALEEYEQGDGHAARRVCENATAYITLLRQHIDKENHCLFPMANQVFAQVDQSRLSEVFRKVDEEKVGRDKIDGFVQFADRLAEEYGVRTVCDEPSAEGTAAGPCGR